MSELFKCTRCGLSHLGECGDITKAVLFTSSPPASKVQEYRLNPEPPCVACGMPVSPENAVNRWVWNSREKKHESEGPFHRGCAAILE
jgi:hypothetical protein